MCRKTTPLCHLVTEPPTTNKPVSYRLERAIAYIAVAFFGFLVGGAVFSNAIFKYKMHLRIGAYVTPEDADDEGTEHLTNNLCVYSDDRGVMTIVPADENGKCHKVPEVSNGPVKHNL